MIGTSISMQSSGEMVYPSITICDGGSPVYVKGIQSFLLKEEMSGYYNATTTKNLTFPRTPDLTNILVQLDLRMSNKTVFTVKPDDLKDRDPLFLVKFRTKPKSCFESENNF